MARTIRAGARIEFLRDTASDARPSPARASSHRSETHWARVLPLRSGIVRASLADRLPGTSGWPGGRLVSAKFTSAPVSAARSGALKRTWIWTRAVPLLALGVAMQVFAIVLVGAGQDSLGWALQGVFAGFVLCAVIAAMVVAQDRKLLAGFKPSTSMNEGVDWLGIRVGPTRSALRELGAEAKLLTSLYRVSISAGTLTLRSLPHNSPVLALELDDVSEVKVGYAIWLGKHSPAVIVMVPTATGGAAQLPLVMKADSPPSVVSGRDLEQRAAVLRSEVRRARTWCSPSTSLA